MRTTFGLFIFPKITEMHRSVLLWMTIFMICLGNDSLAQFSHRYITSGHGMKQIMIVNKQGEVEWTYPTSGRCNDVWQLSNGNVIFSDHNHVREVTLKKEIIWTYDIENGREVHSISPIGKKFLIGVSGSPAQLIELNKKGKATRIIELDTKIEKAHGQFRQVRKSRQGTYFAGLMKTGKLLEIDQKGNIVREIDLPGQGFTGIPLPNGNVLIACGDGHCILEIDRQNKVVWELKDGDIPGIPLRFIAGLHRLPNGNTVVCNWGGHGYKGQQAQIFEVSRDKQLIGSVFDNDLFTMPSTIQILDMDGRPEKGQLFK
jgi:hypothetical protein